MYRFITVVHEYMILTVYNKFHEFVSIGQKKILWSIYLYVYNIEVGTLLQASMLRRSAYKKTLANKFLGKQTTAILELVKFVRVKHAAYEHVGVIRFWFQKEKMLKKFEVPQHFGI